MNKSFVKILIVIILGGLVSISPAASQKKKVDFKKGKSLINKVKKMTEPEKKSSSGITLPADNTQTVNNDSNERKLAPPDVNKEIENANAAFAEKSYAEARFYIQQAIMGIELQIGYEILNSMPEEVLGVKADKTQDVVYSTGAGFTGMEVSRDYPQDIGHTKAIIANSTILNGTAQFAVTSMAAGSYDENTKVTRYKGYKAVLEADQYSGFKMSIPLGQSTVFMIDCGTCQTEEELLETADTFDIEKYKTLLGEK